MAPLFALILVLAPAPAFAQTAKDLRPRSDVSAYLATVNDHRKFGTGADDDKKFAADAELAVKAYQYLRGGRISTKDDQTFASAGFFMRTGDATFNPNPGQTRALQGKLDGHFATGPLLQVDLIYEALVATDGNLTLAFGSLAQLFCARREDYVAKVADMDKADGKNYYRFAGAFIGLHGWTTRVAGMGGAYANIGGNPVVYAGYEVYDAWKSYFTTGQMKGIDTLKTLGPEGNGNLVDKGGQLQLGFAAAENLRGKF
jgi:hypothetical protein